MQFVVYGLLTDYQNRILLQKVTDESLAPVGRAVEPGTLPAETLARAFREETGLIVLPVRTTGVYYSGRGDGRLVLFFRCTMRGGDLRVPDGSSPAGFFDSAILPKGLSAAHRQQIDDALHHAGGPPWLGREAGGVGAWLGRLMGRSEAAAGGPAWDVAVRLGAAGESDEVAMAVVDGNGDATRVMPGDAPWEAAARLAGTARNVRLIGVEIAATRPSLTLVFAGVG